MKRYLGLRILYTAAFVLSLGAYRAFTAGRDPFQLTGTALVVWNLLRLELAACICLVTVGCGALVLRPWLRDQTHSPRNAQDILLWLLAGGAMISLVNYGLGLVGAYVLPLYWALCLAVLFLSAPLLHEAIGFVLGNAFRLPARSENFRRLFAILYYVALAVCFIIIAQVFLIKVLYPDFGGSIYYYFLYLEKAKAAHSILPRYFDVFTFFPTKASGLHYLVAILSGIEALTLASVPYLFAAFLTSYLFLKEIAKNSIYPFLGIIVIATNAEFIVLTNNFSKTNFSLAVIVFVFAYLAYVLIFKKTGRPKATLVTLCLLAAQLGLYTGMIFFYSCGVIFFIFLLSLIYNRTYLSKSIYIFFILSSVYCLCGAINYYYLGVCDHSTLYFQLNNNLIKLSDKYINYTNIDFLGLIQKDGKIVSNIQTYLSNIYKDVTSSGFLASSFTPVAWIMLLIGLLAWAWDSGKKPRRTLFYWFGFNLVLLAGLIVFRSVIASEYVRKHSSLLFGMFFKSNIYIFSFVLFRELFLKNGKPLYDTAILLLVCTTAVIGHPFNFRDDFRERVAFMEGKFSPQSAFDRYYPDLRICRQALSHLQTPRQRLLPLAVYTVCTGYSYGRSVDPTEPFPLNDYLTMFYGSPDQAAAKLHAVGIDFFLFDFSQAPRDYIFSPIFSPDQIMKRFRIVEAHDDVYLLTWKSSDNSGLPPDFLQKYKKYLEKCSKQHFDDSYQSKFNFLESKISYQDTRHHTPYCASLPMKKIEAPSYRAYPQESPASCRKFRFPDRTESCFAFRAVIFPRTISSKRSA